MTSPSADRVTFTCPRHRTPAARTQLNSQPATSRSPASCSARATCPQSPAATTPRSAAPQSSPSPNPVSRRAASFPHAITTSPSSSPCKISTTSAT